MRATVRWLLTLFAILFMGEWLRSCDHILHIRGPIGDHRTLRFVNGYVVIWTEPDYWSWTPGIEEFATDRIGLESRFGRDRYDPSGGFCIPLWMPMLLMAVPAGFMWRTVVIRRKSKMGLCRKCAYNRHGLTPDAPCPECGSKP